MEVIPLVFCVDAEPDDRVVAETEDRWPALEATFHLADELRPRFEDATGAPAHFSWFLRMDPQVEHVFGKSEFVAVRYGERLHALEAAGDELGLHTHAWRWDGEAEHWVTDHGDQAWVEHCVRTGSGAFERGLGRAPRSHRFGDHWLNDPTVALLDELGVEVELTIEPGMAPEVLSAETTTGAMPDYRRAQRRPYRPSRRNFLATGRLRPRRIRLLPLSAGPRPGVEMTEDQPTDRRTGLYLEPHEGFVPANLAFLPSWLTPILDGVLQVARLPCLAVVMRCDATVRADERPNLDANVEHLLSHPLAERFRLMRPDEALAALGA